MKKASRNNLIVFVFLVIVLVTLVLVTPVELDPWIVLFGVLPVVVFAYRRGTGVKRVAKVAQTVAQVSRQIRWAEIRKSMTSSLNIAFGLTIGLVWANVITFGFAAMGLPLTAATANPVSWGLYVIAAFGVTFICLLGIYVTARWKETVVQEEEIAEEEEEKEKKK